MLVHVKPAPIVAVRFVSGEEARNSSRGVASLIKIGAGSKGPIGKILASDHLSLRIV